MTAVVLRQRPGGAELAEAVLDGVLWRCTSSRSAYGCLGRVRRALERAEEAQRDAGEPAGRSAGFCEAVGPMP